MTIARLLEGRPATITCEAGMPVHEAIALLAERRIGALPVMRDNEVAGIFSERDVIYCLAQAGSTVLNQPVGEVMTSPAVTATPDTGILDALALMTRRRIRHLPVVESGAMIGFVSIGDLVKFRIERVETEAQAMRDYIQTA